MILSHFFVGEESAPKTAILLHGALGAGHNFRSFARRIAAQIPDYRFILVDVRNHGASQGAPGPHTLEACVGDLLELSAYLNVTPRSVIGHSFGGKVALAYGRRLRGENSPLAQALHQVWALDSDPGVQIPDPNHEVLRVLHALTVAPGPFPARAEAVSNLLSQGLSSGLANWLTTNLERQGDAYVWKLNVAAIRELMDDYFREDLWPTLASASGEPEYHLVVAENSDRWTGTMRETAKTLPAAAKVQVHDLPNSGHWVHVDNPDGLLAIFEAHLS